MKNIALKAALAAMGVRCDDEELSQIVDILDEKFGIIACKLDVASPQTEDVIKEMTKDAKKDKLLFQKTLIKQPKNRWVVPKKIGKPQKRKG